MQVFDSHRLMYRNARLRAFSKANPTTQLEFQENDGTNIGEIVYTNANGYLCRSSDMQIILGLKLPESAIIQVSLDGGVSWPIGWILDDEGSVLHTEDIGTMSYYDEDGNLQTWDPLNGDVELPEYALKDEVSEWHESTICIDDDTCYIKPDQWTKTIHLTGNATADTIQIDLVAARFAQVIAVSGKSINRRFIIETQSMTWDSKFNYDTEKIPAGYSLLIQMSKNNNDKIFTVAVIPTFSIPTVTSMINTAIANAKGEVQQVGYLQNDGNFQADQYIDPTTAVLPTAPTLIFTFMSTSTSSGVVTLKLPYPAREGTFNILVVAGRQDTVGAYNMYMQVGLDTRVLIGSWTGGAGALRLFVKLVVYKIGGTTYNAVVQASEAIDLQAH